MSEPKKGRAVQATTADGTIITFSIPYDVKDPPVLTFQGRVFALKDGRYTETMPHVVGR